MISTFLILILFLIFSTLGIIHFYWAKGGKWGFKNAIPTKENGDLVMNPKTIDSIMVGVYLTIIAIFYLLQIDFFEINFPNWTSYILWIVPSIFFLRAVGDFKYIAFLNKLKLPFLQNGILNYFLLFVLFLALLDF